MGSRNLIRAFVRAALLSFLSLTGIAEPRSNGASRVLPDLFTHLGYAVESLDAGRWAAARAHSDVVLLDAPIHIFVEHESLDPVIRERCEAAAKRALSEWSQALGGDVVFEDSDKAIADVVLWFQERRLDRGLGGAGKASWRRTVTVYPGGEASGTLQASVEVRVLDFRGRLLPEDRIANIAMHEIGHVLGLKESSRVGDLMGPIDLRRPVLAPTSEEVVALSQVRSEARQIKARSELYVMLGL